MSLVHAHLELVHLDQVAGEVLGQAIDDLLPAMAHRDESGLSVGFRHFAKSITQGLG